MSVVTLLTVQNTQSASVAEVIAPELVLAQLNAVLDDIPPDAAKTGALGNAEVVRAVADRAATFAFPLVVDPVMLSKHRAPLLTAEAVTIMKRSLLPRAFLVTPNLDEAGALSGISVYDDKTMEEAACRIAGLGVSGVLVKGGHLAGEAVDVLWWRDEVLHFRAPRIGREHLHGTGCTFSAAITAELAKGRQLADAVATAKEFMTLAIQSRPGLGKGHGPVNHHVRID